MGQLRDFQTGGGDGPSGQEPHHGGKEHHHGDIPGFEFDVFISKLILDEADEPAEQSPAGAGDEEDEHGSVHGFNLTHPCQLTQLVCKLLIFQDLITSSLNSLNS